MKWQIAVLFCLLGRGLCLAEAYPVPVHVEASKNFSTAGQYYDLSVGGINSYMEQLRQDDPQTYRKLEPKVASLNSRRLWGMTSLIGGVGVGLVALYAGALSGPNIPLCAGGAAFAIAGPIVGAIISPSKSDLLDFVNQHNRIKPGTPLNISDDSDLELMPNPTRITGLRFEF